MAHTHRYLGFTLGALRFNGTYTQRYLAHKSTGMFGYWMLEIVNCIRGGFNGTNPRGSTPQSAETAEICGTNLWQFLIVLLEKIDKFAKHTQQISFKLVSYFQQCLFSLGMKS